jgi:hypothetical protein
MNITPKGKQQDFWKTRRRGREVELITHHCHDPDYFWNKMKA